jgi:hypothetical protein
MYKVFTSFVKILYFKIIAAIFTVFRAVHVFGWSYAITEFHATNITMFSCLLQFNLLLFHHKY